MIRLWGLLGAFEARSDSAMSVGIGWSVGKPVVNWVGLRCFVLMLVFVGVGGASVVGFNIFTRWTLFSVL